MPEAGVRFVERGGLRWVAAAVVLLGCRGVGGQATPDYLAGNTVLIIRHAEKPKLGAGLTATGEKRAAAYVRYFRPLHEGGVDGAVTALYAAADSADSNRPRLTLEPLAAAAAIKLDATVGTKQPEVLVSRMRAEPHGVEPLICWRHGSIPALLTAFGASPEKVLPGGKWPDEVYDWMVVLRFDAQGHVAEQRLVHESLTVE